MVPCKLNTIDLSASQLHDFSVVTVKSFQQDELHFYGTNVDSYMLDFDKKATNLVGYFKYSTSHGNTKI